LEIGESVLIFLNAVAGTGDDAGKNILTNVWTTISLEPVNRLTQWLLPCSIPNQSILPMKKFILSTGLVAISAAGWQAASAATVLSPKAWSISATLRGFYDDNYTSSTQSRGSGGLELSPTISFNAPLARTDLGMRYTYGLYYYQDRQDIGVNPFDQSHLFELWLTHKFNTRWTATARDSFAIGQEPELLQTASSAPFRTSGDNMANHANFSLETQWTHKFSTAIHYGNAWVDYDNAGGITTPFVPVLGAVQAVNVPVNTPGLDDGSFYGVTASLAGKLNRVEHSAGVDFTWAMGIRSSVFVGYNFGLVNYTGNEDVAAFNYVDTAGHARSLIYRSDSRDTMSHYGYVGFAHEFTANIQGTLRAGVNYTESFNNPLSDDPSLSPYVDMNVSYTFIPGSFVQLGVTHDINSTDVTDPNQSNGKITAYQESTVVFVDVNHKFNSKLRGTVIGRFQNSTYNGGNNDGGNDQSYGVGVNLAYQINRHFSTEVGYNYDDLISGLSGRDYGRGRYYFGVTASY
jgi:hypothetical protein